MYDITPDSKIAMGEQGESDLLNDKPFPNIAQLFDLFPYVMYYSGLVTVDGKEMHEYKYSYPLGLEG